jgi:hypothetical protein
MAVPSRIDNRNKTTANNNLVNEDALADIFTRFNGMTWIRVVEETSSIVLRAHWSLSRRNFIIRTPIQLEHLHTIGSAASMGCRMKFLNILRS